MTTVIPQHTLFAFTSPEAAHKWQAVNDGVMGGVSDGRFQVTEEGTLAFFGTCCRRSKTAARGGRKWWRRVVSISPESMGCRGWFGSPRQSARRVSAFRAELDEPLGLW